jgi:hypothetical protein
MSLVSSGGLGASELRLITAPHQQEGFTLCVYVVFSVLFCDGEMVTHPEIRVKFSTPFPRTGATLALDRARGVMCPTNVLGSDRFPCSLLWFWASLFRSTVIIIGDG